MSRQIGPVPESGPTSVVVDWPADLDPWIRSLLLQRSGGPMRPPEIPPAAWGTWLAAVQRHGLGPLLATWLGKTGVENRPPKEVMEALRALAFDGTAEVALRRSQLGALLKALEGAGIQAVVLKGAFLAESCYSRPEMRPVSDLDLLIRPQAFPRAREVVLGLGYESRKGEGIGARAWDGEEEFVSTDGQRRFMVDLHWSLSPFAHVARQVSLSTLFTRAEQLTDAGPRMWGLEPGDALVHAALHLIYANTDNIRLIWVYDLHLLAARVTEAEAWDRVLSTSVTWQARLALMEGLALSGRWFGTAYPAEVADLSRFPPLEREYEMHRISHSKRSSREKLHLLRMQGLGFKERLDYFRNRLFPERRELELYYPQLRSWPSPLNYLGRLVLSLLGRPQKDLS